MTVNTHAQSFLTNGLVAYYPLNGNASDVSGNGYNGAVSSNCSLTNDRFGNVGGAIFINNKNVTQSTVAHIDLPPAALNSIKAGTISAWVKPQDITYSVITAKQHDGVGTYAFFAIGGHLNPASPPGPASPGVLYFNATGTTPVAMSTATVTSNVWQQVVVVFTTNSCAFYINGTPCGTTNANNYSIPNDSSVDPWIGCWGSSGWGNGQVSIGSFNNVRIYNQALTAAQVAQLYQIESVPPLVITQNLTNSSVVIGQSTNLGVTATGYAPLSYQWYFNGPSNTIQAGATAQTVVNFAYAAVITNGGSGYGNIPAVSFVGGGGNGGGGYGTISNGVVTGIVVTSTGSNYTSLPSVVIDPPNGILTGATNNTLAITNASAANVGNYYVTVTDGIGTTISSRVASLTLLYPPTVTNNPVGFSASLHGSGSMSVTAAGTPPFSYQWMLNGTNVYGATNSNFIISSLNTTNAGGYTVQVTNSYGYATSSIAYVELLPSLTSPFAGAIGLWGQNLLLGVSAVGSGSLSYQWYFNGTVISGANGSTYALNSVQFTDAGLYNVVVSSIYGSVTNTAYQVVVNPANVGIGTCPIIYIAGTAGYNYTIQSTTNLANVNSWVTVTNIILPSSSLIWADTATDITLQANPKKFYRVLPGQ